MKEFEFVLTFALATPSTDADDYLERLYESGCDDALVGVGRKGRIALSFVRKAESAESAILGAIQDACRAIPDATLIEASPDLVGLTDVADLLDVSRQNVRKLILECGVAPPAPVHEGRPTIWHLIMVLRWLREHKDYSVPDELVDVAQTTMLVNLALGRKAADQMGIGTLHDFAACAV